jgi:DNA segregation ATPase FtsK/SpoIIIE-like protein
VAGNQTQYKAAVRLVLQHQSASVALVQRHLRLGYADACKLFERMQAEGIVVSVVAAGRIWALSQAKSSATDGVSGGTS